MINMAKTSIGTPCKRGHQGMRYVLNRGCVDCAHNNRRARKKEHAAYMKIYRTKLDYKERTRRAQQKYRENPEVAVRVATFQARRRGEIATIEIPKRFKPTICDICGNAAKLSFDHCHKTGRFRGWLCQNCNAGLGMAKDSSQILSKMISYLGVFNPEDMLCLPR